MTCFVVGMDGLWIWERRSACEYLYRFIRLASVHCFNMDKQQDCKPAYDSPMFCRFYR